MELRKTFLWLMMTGLRRLSYIERIYYATFTSDFKSEITYIGKRTRLAPLALANCATRLPIVPAPDTTTFLPFKSPHVRNSRVGSASLVSGESIIFVKS